jgi:hypothetical protein
MSGWQVSGISVMMRIEMAHPASYSRIIAVVDFHLSQLLLIKT